MSKENKAWDCIMGLEGSTRLDTCFRKILLAVAEDGKSEGKKKA